jgi:hypothetical protein
MVEVDGASARADTSSKTARGSTLETLAIAILGAGGVATAVWIGFLTLAAAYLALDFVVGRSLLL